MHLGHHGRIASSFVDPCTDNQIGVQVQLCTCVHIKYINSYTTRECMLSYLLAT